MKFSTKYADLKDPHYVHQGDVECEVSPEQINRIAANWVDTLAEWGCLEDVEPQDEEDLQDNVNPLDSDMLDAYNLIVFGACPELEQTLDDVLAKEVGDNPDFANGYIWPYTEKWIALQDAGEEIAVPEIYFDGLPDEIRAEAQKILDQR